MNYSAAFKSFLEKSLHLDLFFAVYREPESKHLTYVCQKNSAINNFDLTSEKDVSGFVIYPFKGSEGFLIQADILVKSNDTYFPELESVNYTNYRSNPIPNTIDKVDYTNQLNQLIQDLKDNKANKVVYSRVKEVDFTEDYLGAFFKLENSNSDALVYLFNIPGKNIWLGATPEILLKNENGNVNTMALASTRKSNDADIVWNQKEIEEHQYVSDYIIEKLSKNKVNWDSDKTYNKQLKSGLTHLCKEFRMKLNQENFLKITNELHPTPAIAGMPVNSAFKLIEKYEHHNREYYTGFLGPLNLDETSALYVNLRCARLTPKKCYLFLGGGITKDSNVEDEWEETELKAQTVLKVLQTPHKIKIFGA